jgi:hypothetical protein
MRDYVAITWEWINDYGIYHNWKKFKDNMETATSNYMVILIDSATLTTSSILKLGLRRLKFHIAKIAATLKRINTTQLLETSMSKYS